MPTLENSYTSGGLAPPADPLSQSFTITDAKLLLVSINIGDGASRTLTSVKWNTTENLTLVKNQDDANFESAQIWALENPTPGTFNVTLDWDAAPAQAHFTITGWLDGKVSTSTPNGATAATANPSVTVADFVAGEDVLFATYASDLGDVGTTTENHTLIGEAENVVSDSDFSTQYKTTSGKSIGWTAVAPGSGNWAIAAVSIKPIKVTNVQQPLASLWPILVAG